MLHLAILLIGIVIGVILSFLLKRKSNDPPMGSIIFDGSIGENIPYLGIERASDIDVIRTKKYVTLKVDIIKANPQK